MQTHRYLIWSTLSFLFFFILLTRGVEAAYYYVRLDIVSENNRIVDTDLLMLPADNEFRVKKLSRIQVKGHAQIKDGDDIRRAAKQAAIVKLLIDHGLKSVIGNSGLINGTVMDKVKLRYEGVVALPITIQSEGYSLDKASYLINTEMTFSAIAFPDKWQWLYLKKLLQDTLMELVGFF